MIININGLSWSLIIMIDFCYEIVVKLVYKKLNINILNKFVVVFNVLFISG